MQLEKLAPKFRRCLLPRACGPLLARDGRRQPGAAARQVCARRLGDRAALGEAPSSFRQAVIHCRTLSAVGVHLFM